VDRKQPTLMYLHPMRSRPTSVIQRLSMSLADDWAHLCFEYLQLLFNLRRAELGGVHSAAADHVELRSLGRPVAVVGDASHAAAQTQCEQDLCALRREAHDALMLPRCRRLAAPAGALQECSVLTRATFAQHAEHVIDSLLPAALGA